MSRLRTWPIPPRWPLPGWRWIVFNGMSESAFDYVHGPVHQCARVAPNIAGEPQFACGVEYADQGADRKAGVQSRLMSVAEALGDDVGELASPISGQRGEVPHEGRLVG